MLDFKIVRTKRIAKHQIGKSSQCNIKANNHFSDKATQKRRISIRRRTKANNHTPKHNNPQRPKLIIKNHLNPSSNNNHPSLNNKIIKLNQGLTVTKGKKLKTTKTKTHLNLNNNPYLLNKALSSSNLFKNTLSNKMK